MIVPTFHVFVTDFGEYRMPESVSKKLSTFRFRKNGQIDRRNQKAAKIMDRYYRMIARKQMVEFLGHD